MPAKIKKARDPLRGSLAFFEDRLIMKKFTLLSILLFTYTNILQ
jgi:hypothetical protein